MTLCQIHVKKEAAYSCIYELGEVGLVHFNSLNTRENPVHLKFVKHVAEFDELLGILRGLRQKIEMADIVLPVSENTHRLSAINDKEVIELRDVIKNTNAEVLNMTTAYEELKKEYFEALEVSQVLRKADLFISDGKHFRWRQYIERKFLKDANDVERKQNKKNSDGLRLSYLTGSIPIENFFTFERVLWRVCKGNFLLRHAEITPEDEKKKMVFIIFFHGDGLQEKLRKICQGFGTTLYQCPESSKDRLKQLHTVESRIDDLKKVLEQSDYHRRRVLLNAAGELPKWLVKVKKAMAVYMVMNQMQMDESEHYLVAECWIPTFDLPLVQQALNKAVIKSGSSVPAILTVIKRKGASPPTYNRTNPFTRGFQALIDAYGVGDYRELSPVPFTIVTFPFLFAVMFGDFGHGLLVVLFAGWMVFTEKTSGKRMVSSEIGKIIFDGRYVLLLMGLFSMFTGLIYNEVFSKPVTLFQPAWKIYYNESTVLSNPFLALNPATAYRQSPYVFGVDPVWSVSGENSVVAMNSLKMKISIILGVVHMYFGMCLGAWNHIFDKSYADLLCICIPQLVFFSLFVYLVVLIWLKWMFYSSVNPLPYTTSCAPSILTTFIDMVLFKDSGNKAPNGCEKYMFANQRGFQSFLMAIALICVPIMFLSKPLYIMWKKRRSLLQQAHKFKNGAPGGKVDILTNNSKLNGTENGFKVQILQPNVDEDSSSSSYLTDDDVDDAPIDEELQQDISDVFIFQSIGAIEIVLGSVSHTASYLRLWALSLAHAQLSNVLWDMVMSRGLHMQGVIGVIFLVFAFLVWSVLTVSILILMEGLSAFLHTLRLHWVEFQSKFYSGSGEAFQPFNFEKVLNVAEE